MDAEQRLADLYAAFNRRDIPKLLTAMATDVSWPNGWEGGTVHGHEALAAYWRRQWEQIEPSVVPIACNVLEDGRVAVTVHQVVRDKAGALLTDHTVTHVYRFTDGLVAEMEIKDQ